MTLIDRVLQNERVDIEVFHMWLRGRGITEAKFRRSAIIGIALGTVFAGCLCGFLVSFFGSIFILATVKDDFGAVIPWAVGFLSCGALALLFFPFLIMGSPRNDFSEHVNLLRRICNCRGDKDLTVQTFWKRFEDKLVAVALQKLRAQIIMFNGRVYGEERVRKACREWEEADKEWQETHKVFGVKDEWLDRDNHCVLYFAIARRKLSPEEREELDG